VDSLDAALLLDSAAFRRRREEIEKAFLASPVRPAAHVGGAYDRDPAALRDRLSRLLDEAAAGAPPLPEGPLAGLIAPHIDMHRGGAGYGAAYRAAAALSRAETFVVLGTVHAAPPEPYTATRKAYATPLGAVESDAAFLDRLEALYGARLFANEAAHRSEHSIEFQAVWIRFLAGERTVRIAPILCSSFHEAVAAGRDPSADARVADFAAALREVLAERPGAAVIAAADLAHLGPRFGDREPVGDRTASWCAARDRAILERAAAGDAAGFFAPIAEETDRRRICGVSAVWTLLEVLPPGARGTLLHYGQALDEERTTLVSFASVAFTSQS
jgi:AmmeMemoRadiSam system protein B